MLVVVGALWFSTSALLSTWANTTFLQTFKDPLLHTFIRFLGSVILGAIHLLVTREIKLVEFGQVVHQVVVPATLLWVANYFNSISLKAAGITLTYVVKACIPVFTVLICTFTGQKFPVIIYISLIPICLGVALASGSDLDFTILGLAAAFTSAFAQTLMNISIKSVRGRTGYSGPKAFLGMTIVCTGITALVMVANALSLDTNQSITFSTPPSVQLLITIYDELLSNNLWPAYLVAISSFAYHCEYLLNFVFVGYVNSVMFSVADIVRRIAIIVVGGIVFNKVLTASNWLGIAVALGGVLWYSYLDSQLTKATVNFTGKEKKNASGKTPQDNDTVNVSEGSPVAKNEGKVKHRTKGAVKGEAK